MYHGKYCIRSIRDTGGVEQTLFVFISFSPFAFALFYLMCCFYVLLLLWSLLLSSSFLLLVSWNLVVVSFGVWYISSVSWFLRLFSFLPCIYTKKSSDGRKRLLAPWLRLCRPLVVLSCWNSRRLAPAFVTPPKHCQATLLVSVCGMYLVSGVVFLVAARYMPELDAAIVKGTEVSFFFFSLFFLIYLFFLSFCCFLENREWMYVCTWCVFTQRATNECCAGGVVLNFLKKIQSVLFGLFFFALGRLGCVFVLRKLVDGWVRFRLRGEYLYHSTGPSWVLCYRRR